MANKKTLYHSELVKMGAIQVRITSDVIPSKFNGKPPWVEMEIDGEVRQYTTENEQCEEALTGLNGKSVMLEATGARDEAAINILANSPGGQRRANPPEEEGQGQQRSQARPKGAKARQERPAAQRQPLPDTSGQEGAQQERNTRKPAQTAQQKDSVDIVIDTRKWLARRGNLFRLSAQEALRQIEACAISQGMQFGPTEKQAVVMAMMDKMAETMVTSLFISADRAGQGAQMPFGDLDKLLAEAKERQANKK